ncbi:hypothetical protein COJ01_17410 [Priestia megaterium]|uniref:hypothetical protein n=1 Tax=Priestia megaterium TaxID=1404 RepID=UPI000BF68640|nr:hypothetical protein [Priestia megaterium]PFK99845.1 hypothetical protein COJ01_17410 [Priestia megaterium]
MKIEIRSLAGELEPYMEYLRGKIANMDSHLAEMSYENKKWFILKDVEIDSLQDLADIFKDMDEPMGYAGHITFDAKNGVVYILDSWIE